MPCKLWWYFRYTTNTSSKCIWQSFFYILNLIVFLEFYRLIFTAITKYSHVNQCLSGSFYSLFYLLFFILFNSKLRMSENISVCKVLVEHSEIPRLQILYFLYYNYINSTKLNTIYQYCKCKCNQMLVEQAGPTSKL